MPKVGHINLGLMGMSIPRNITKAGFPWRCTTVPALWWTNWNEAAYIQKMKWNGK
jgi:3-hydroxyisobutyrate dehydrogenase-like beta-hydroxyacid dehydrogenase